MKKLAVLISTALVTYAAIVLSRFLKERRVISRFQTWRGYDDVGI